MTNFKYFLLALTTTAGVVGARAEAVTPYAVDFNKSISTSAHDFKVGPGWGHVVAGYTDDYYDTHYVTYTYQSTGGVDDSGCLQVGTQTIGSGYDTRTVKDALVTPPLTGAASIRVKKAANSGTVKFYNVTLSGTTYRVGTEISTTLPELNTTDFVQVDIPVTEENQQIGIVFDNVYIDDFAAASADIVLNPALKITKVAYTSQTYYDADPEGNVNFLYKVLVQNTGDVDLAPGDENYSISVVNYSQSGAVVATVPIEQSLAVGAVSDTIFVPFSFSAATYPNRNRYDAKENITGTTSYGTWIEPVPYEPRFVFSDENSSTAYSGSGLVFGLTSTDVSKTHKFRNTGGAPLNLTEITVPEGYEISVAAPLTIAAHQDVPVTITLKADVPGTKVGNLVVKGDGVDFSLPLSGAVVDNSKWYVNFEDNAFPAGTVVGENWSVTNYPSQVNIANNKYCAANGNVVGTKFISPLLHVDEGEVLVFDAARRSANSTVNVYYSADRQNWTQVRALSATSTNDDDRLPATTYSSNKYKFQQYAINNIPAGDYYVAFESGYAYIDNIMGYTPVEVSHDIMLNSTAFPATGNVNKRYEGKVSLKNVAATAEAADSYTAQLMAGEEVIATAQAIEIPASSDVELTFAYTPHVAGPVEAVAVIDFDGYIVSTDTLRFTIGEETSAEQIQVGNPSSTMGYAPLSLNYKNSETEEIYPASMLGIEAGSKISRIAFRGYNGAATLETQVRAWIENTEQTMNGAQMADTLAMTKIFDGPVTFEMKGSSKATEEMLVFELAEPFVYTGNSIRLHILHTADAYKSISFEVQGSIGNQALYRRSDASLATAQAAKPYSTALPVVYLSIVKDPTDVSGIISDASTSAPIAGASIKLVSTTTAALAPAEGDTEADNEADKVIYNAVTEADGSYSMPVFQNNLTYVATVSAEGYKPQTIDFEPLGAATYELNAALEPDGSTAVTDVDIDGVKVYGTAGAIVVKAAQATTVNVYNVAGALVARINAAAGTTRMAMPRGIYVAGRAKVVVK